MSSVFLLYHRGFGLLVQAHRAAGGALVYHVRVMDGGQPLHAPDVSYRSVVAAERAARRFVDDALGAYSWACARLEASVYSSSK